MESIKKISVVKLVTVFLSYVMAYLYVDQFFGLVESNNVVGVVGVILFTMGFVVWNELVMFIQRQESKYVVSRTSLIEARFWEIILLALSGLVHFCADEWLVVFAMHIVVVYMVLCGSGHLAKNETSIYLPGDLFNGYVIIPLRNFIVRIFTVIDSVKDLAKDEESSSNTSKTKKVFIALISVTFVIIAIGVFWTVFGLLSDLDDTFKYVYDASSKAIVEFFKNFNIFNIFGTFIISVPVGAYLSGLFFGSIRHNYGYENKIANTIDANYKRIKVIPAVIFYIVSALFIVMYLLFFISQSRLLFSGFAGIIPGKLTASEYAVDGFEQLATVLIINFMGLGVMRLFSSRSVVDSKLTAAGSITLMVTSMIFAVISASKIILYISRFGYTPLRFESMWFTVVAFVGAGAAIFNIISTKKTFKSWLLFATVTFIIMNIIAGICSL